MNGEKLRTACTIKLDSINYLKDRTVCKSCYNMKRRKKNNNTLTKSQQPKIDNVTNNNKNRTLKIGFSNGGKTYLITYFLLQKFEQIFIITKSLNQYPNIKAQTSVEVQPLENYENSILVFDDMLLSNKKAILICFLLEDVTKILI